MPFEGWVWPLPALDGRRPSISDGFGYDKRGGRGHLGVDVMFWSDVEMTPNPPENSRRFFVPRGHPVIAAGPATVWAVYRGTRGWQIKLDHGRVIGDAGPWVSFYSHLETVNAGIKKGAQIPAGALLGTVGDDPSNTGDPRHLHFEMWRTDRGGARREWAVDPRAYLEGFQVVNGSGRLPAKSDITRALIARDAPSGETGAVVADLVDAKPGTFS